MIDNKGPGRSEKRPAESVLYDDTALQASKRTRRVEELVGGGTTDQPGTLFGSRNYQNLAEAAAAQAFANAEAALHLVTLPLLKNPDAGISQGVGRHESVERQTERGVLGRQPAGNSRLHDLHHESLPDGEGQEAELQAIPPTEPQDGAYGLDSTAAVSLAATGSLQTPHFKPLPLTATEEMWRDLDGFYMLQYKQAVITVRVALVGGPAQLGGRGFAESTQFYEQLPKKLFTVRTPDCMSVRFLKRRIWAATDRALLPSRQSLVFVNPEASVEEERYVELMDTGGDEAQLPSLRDCQLKNDAIILLGLVADAQPAEDEYLSHTPPQLADLAATKTQIASAAQQRRLPKNLSSSTVTPAASAAAEQQQSAGAVQGPSTSVVGNGQAHDELHAVRRPAGGEESQRLAATTNPAPAPIQIRHAAAAAPVVDLGTPPRSRPPQGAPMPRTVPASCPVADTAVGPSAPGGAQPAAATEQNLGNGAASGLGNAQDETAAAHAAEPAGEGMAGPSGANQGGQGAGAAAAGPHSEEEEDDDFLGLGASPQSRKKRWQLGEMHELIEGVRKFGYDWVTILKRGSFPTHRRNVHMKDKWRNMYLTIAKGKVERGVQMTPSMRNSVMELVGRFGIPRT